MDVPRRAPRLPAIALAFFLLASPFVPPLQATGGARFELFEEPFDGSFLDRWHIDEPGLGVYVEDHRLHMNAAPGLPASIVSDEVQFGFRPGTGIEVQVYLGPGTSQPATQALRVVRGDDDSRWIEVSMFEPGDLAAVRDSDGSGIL